MLTLWLRCVAAFVCCLLRHLRYFSNPIPAQAQENLSAESRCRRTSPRSWRRRMRRAPCWRWDGLASARRKAATKTTRTESAASPKARRARRRKKRSGRAVGRTASTTRQRRGPARAARQDEDEDERLRRNTVGESSRSSSGDRGAWAGWLPLLRVATCVIWKVILSVLYTTFFVTR
ncbi:unnamed protein product [Phaeothamnion confervicola]